MLSYKIKDIRLYSFLSISRNLFNFRLVFAIGRAKEAIYACKENMVLSTIKQRIGNWATCLIRNENLLNCSVIMGLGVFSNIEWKEEDHDREKEQLKRDKGGYFNGWSISDF